MARKPEFESVYAAFNDFLDRCLRKDLSLLWPTEPVWTADNVAEVKRRMVDNPAPSTDLSFQEKLQEQMEGASSQHWMLISDVYYTYFLPSTFIKWDTKLRDTGWAAQQGGVTPPPDSAEIWQAQSHGFTRTSLKYHQKYLQFWLILLFADHVKEQPASESILTNPQQMQHALDELLQGIPNKNDRAYDMRHAMLYMAFPDLYERIISTRHKALIVEAYRSRIQEPDPWDLDEAIRRIRETLSEEHDQPDRPFDFYNELEDEWRTTKPPTPTPAPTPEPKPADVDERAVLSVLDRTRNVILYGPPGTGKTYIAKRAAEAMVEPQIQKPLPEPALFQRAIEGLTFYEVLAASLYHSGPDGSYKAPEILKQPLVRARYQVSPVKYPGPQIWYYLLTYTSPEIETVGTAKRREPYLFDKDAEGRWSLTEIGRTYVEQNLSEQLSLLKSEQKPQSAADFVTWTTFHQSYAYEDFVEGLRPISSEEAAGDITYEIVPGVFKRVCRRASEDPDNKYVLVIDEINRGNIAKILGELITLLEDDKRLGEPNELSISLPYSGETFSVPANLYIIGTMNTADRSIALLDVALRRRFAFVELLPRPELLAGALVESQETVVPLQDLLIALNQRIRRLRDRDHQIGHSYLLKVAQATEADRPDALEFVWNNQILPLLEEYFYGQRETLAELLAAFRTDVEPGIEEIDEEGVDFELGRQQGDDLMAALAKLAESAGQQATSVAI